MAAFARVGKATQAAEAAGVEAEPEPDPPVAASQPDKPTGPRSADPTCKKVVSVAGIYGSSYQATLENLRRPLLQGNPASGLARARGGGCALRDAFRPCLARTRSAPMARKPVVESAFSSAKFQIVGAEERRARPCSASAARRPLIVSSPLLATHQSASANEKSTRTSSVSAARKPCCDEVMHPNIDEAPSAEDVPSWRGFAGRQEERVGPGPEKRLELQLKKARAEWRAQKAAQREKIATAVANGRATTTIEKPTRDAARVQEQVERRQRMKAQQRREQREVLEEYQQMLERVSARPLLIDGLPQRPNYYNVLQIASDAIPMDIEASYKELLASLVHKNEADLMDPEADARVTHFYEAYAVLMDPGLRREHDQYHNLVSLVPQSALARKIQADLEKRVRGNRKKMAAAERQRKQELEEAIERGTSSAPLIGIRRTQRPGSATCLREASEKTRLEIKAVSKEQRALIKEIRARASWRDIPGQTGEADDLYAALRPIAIGPAAAKFRREPAKRAAENKLDLEEIEERQVAILQEACARGEAKSMLLGSCNSGKPERSRAFSEAPGVRTTSPSSR